MTDSRQDCIPLKALSLHASAVCIDGQALIFLGPSMSGKSTICRLFGTFANPLADDRIYAILTSERGWTVKDATSHDRPEPVSESEASDTGSIPLQAVFRLYQSSTTYLEPISALGNCRYLTDAFFEIAGHRSYDTDMKKAAFARIAAIARSVPGYKLHFDRTQQVAQVITKQVVAPRQPGA